MIHVGARKTCFTGYFDKITMVLPNHGLTCGPKWQPTTWAGCFTIIRLQVDTVPTWIVACATIAGTTVTAETFHVELAHPVAAGPLQWAAVVEVQWLRKWQWAAVVEVQWLRKRRSAVRNETKRYC
nr:unnamed protein product [uncultured bacterium]